MKKSFYGLILIGLIAANAEAKEALVVLSANQSTVTKEIVQMIEQQKGRIKHILSPHILIGDVPPDIASSLKNKPGIESISYRAVDSKAISERYGPIAGYGAEIWNRNYASPPKARPLKKEKPCPLINDALIPPKPSLPHGLAAEKPIGTSDNDTSAFMVGRIAVAVILPESNGKIDTSTEDWNEDREIKVISQVQAGMDWWAKRAPQAQLQFSYKFYLPSTRPEIVSTSYEPINNPQSSERLWINQIMTRITGHSSGTHLEKVRYYDNQLRNELDTDWAFTIFVVDSFNDNDGSFRDGYFAYCWVGGPFMVMTYDNDGWGIGNMDKVCAHEMGHIFYALDEYSGSGCSCNDYSGYLNVRNGNYVACGDQRCIMRSESGQDADNVCDFTRGQVGLWTKQDGSLMVLGTATISLQAEEGLTYHGTASIVSQPNLNPYGEWSPESRLIQGMVAQVQYEIHNASWSSGWRDTIPRDGSFDNQSEAFSLTLMPPAKGSYTLQTRLINSIGMVIHPPYNISTFSTGGLLSAELLKIHQTNITDSQVTISWITATPTVGYINYDSKTAYDVRGKDVVDTKHYVNISNLKPNTTYTYTLFCQGIFSDNYTVTTASSIAPPGGSQIIHGRVYASDGITPAQGAIVYLRLMDKDGSGSMGSSSKYSALVENNGYWAFDLVNVRTADKQGYFVYSNLDELSIYIEGAEEGTEPLSLLISQASGQSIALGPPMIRSATYYPGTLTLYFNEPVTWNEINVFNGIRIAGQSLPPNSKILEGTPSAVLTIILSQPEAINPLSVELCIEKNIFNDLSGHSNAQTKLVINHLSRKIPVYPNPFSLTDGYITFGSRTEPLTAQVTISVFNLTGELVHSEKLTDCYGQYQWRPGNIASGIYIYLITNPSGEKAIGKLAITK